MSKPVKTSCIKKWATKAWKRGRYPFLAAILLCVATAPIIVARRISPWLDDRLWEYQTLIAGLAALIGGGLAYIAMQDQARATRLSAKDQIAELQNQIATEQARHAELVKRSDDADRVRNVATTVTIALQIAHAIKHQRVSCKAYENGYRKITPNQPTNADMNNLNYLLEQAQYATHRFDQMNDWVRETLSALEPNQQQKVARQIDRAFNSVRAVIGMIGSRNRQVDNRTMPESEAFDQTESHHEMLQACEDILIHVAANAGSFDVPKIAELLAKQNEISAAWRAKREKKE